MDLAIGSTAGHVGHCTRSRAPTLLHLVLQRSLKSRQGLRQSSWSRVLHHQSSIVQRSGDEAQALLVSDLDPAAASHELCDRWIKFFNRRLLLNRLRPQNVSAELFECPVPLCQSWSRNHPDAKLFKVRKKLLPFPA